MSVEEMAKTMRGSETVVFSAGASGRENDQATTGIDATSRVGSISAWRRYPPRSFETTSLRQSSRSEPPQAS
jgi:hypothetical protein